MVNQINGYRFDAIRSDQLRGLGLELRQLQDRDFRHIAHYSEYTALRYKRCDGKHGSAILLEQRPGSIWAESPLLAHEIDDVEHFPVGLDPLSLVLGRRQVYVLSLSKVADHEGFYSVRPFRETINED